MDGLKQKERESVGKKEKNNKWRLPAGLQKKWKQGEGEVGKQELSQVVLIVWTGRDASLPSLPDGRAGEAVQRSSQCTRLPATVQSLQRTPKDGGRDITQ